MINKLKITYLKVDSIRLAFNLINRREENLEIKIKIYLTFCKINFKSLFNSWKMTISNLHAFQRFNYRIICKLLIIKIKKGYLN